MTARNQILIVNCGGNSNIVCSNYLDSKGKQVLAEVEAKFDMFITDKQELLQDYREAKIRVDNKRCLV